MIRVSSNVTCIHIHTDRITRSVVMMIVLFLGEIQAYIPNVFLVTVSLGVMFPMKTKNLKEKLL